MAAGCSTIPRERPGDGFIEIKPTRDAAVLVFEDELEFTATAEWSGGPAVHRETADGLAAALAARRLKADVVQVPVEGIASAELARYRALYIVDTFAIFPPVREAIDAYVRGGGVLVGVCEVGRFPGDWVKPWPFGVLFGLETRPVDQWGTGVSSRDDGFYTEAAIREATSPLVKGLKGTIDLGVRTTHAWVTTPAGAETVAEFVEKDAGPIPALTVNRHGRGAAVFLASLPTGRAPGGWTNAADSVRVLANALALATNRIFVPLRDPREEVVVGWNQVWNEANGSKRVTIRRPAGTGMAETVTFRLANERGEEVRAGSTTELERVMWGSRFVGFNFADVTEPGRYELRVEYSNATGVVTVRLDVAGSFIESPVVAAQAEFFRAMRCGERCHARDPIMGGYHDATADYSVRMWSMPHVVWCLARATQGIPGRGGLGRELDGAIDWCLRMQAPDGAAYAGVQPRDDGEGGWSPAQPTMRPPQDNAERIVSERYSFQYTATMAAALARAAAALAVQGQADWSELPMRGAERAFLRIRTEKVTDTGDLGNRAWAAMELYLATGMKQYLDAARTDIERVLERQLERGRAEVYGGFFADEGKTTFDPQQWKIFHHIGIFMGLIEFARAAPEEDPLRARVEAALNDFTEGHLLGMSSLSPYGQYASGLEPGPDGTFVVRAFPHQKCWVRGHGMNCDLMAMAMVALERYRDTGDERLRDMAARQLDWIMGHNPLGICMITGLGGTEPPMPDPSLGTGPLRGGIPNGITGRGAKNLPMWGYSWDSREYWLPQNAYLLATLALMERVTAP